MAKAKELFDKKQEATEVKDEKLSGDFQELMNKDVVLDKEIQNILNKDGGRCDHLKENQKVDYINFLCEKAGLELTFRPIDLIPTKNGLRPYLNKGASEIIRDKRKISIDDMQIKEVNNMWVVTCRVRNFEGRTDTDVGVCPKKGTEKSPMNSNDSLMKAVTKAKRRATLSMCGLGAIIEEAHPAEYNGEEEMQECKSQILLEDESKAKKYFAEVVKSKMDTGDLEISKVVMNSLCDQALLLANTNKIEEAAKWLQENGEITYSVNEEVDLIMHATIKEVKNGKKQEG